jgi:hypothetical protein
MDETTTKPCTRCREPIPLGATRCAKCQSWQSLGAFMRGNPQAWLGLLFIPFLLVPMYTLFSIRDRGEDFAKHREQVEVLDSQIRIPEDGTSFHDVVTVGRLRNNSPVKWTDVVIEVQYFDRDGKLVGTKTERDLNLVLLPGTEHAFQVSSRAEGPTSTYASQKIFVRDARDARRWP